MGFGLERLEIFQGKLKSKSDILVETVSKIIQSGFHPSNLKHGYVLRKLRECVKNDVVINHQFYYDEINRQERILERYNKLKERILIRMIP